MRIQYGNMLETNTPWYRNYFERAFEAGIFGNLAYNPRFTDGDLPATRNMIALLIRKFLEINQIPLQNSF